MLKALVFWLLPCGTFMIGLLIQKCIKNLSIRNKLQLNNKGLISLFSITFCFISLYKTEYVWVWQIVMNLPIMWFGLSINTPVVPTRDCLRLQKYRILWIVTFLMVDFLFFLCLHTVYSISWTDQSMIESHRISYLYLVVLSWTMVYLFATFTIDNSKANIVILFISCFLLTLVAIMKLIWQSTYLAGLVNIDIISLFSDQVILFNAGILLIISVAFYFALGKGWGTIFNVLLYLFLFISNLLKLKYHDTFFNWFDLLQIKELVLIGREFLTVPIILMIGLSVAVLVVLILTRGSNLKIKLRNLLKLRVNIVPTIAFMILIGSIYNRICEEQYAYLDIYKRTWENESINVRFNGLIVNLLLNLNLMDEVVMDKPAEYGPEAANELLEQFQVYNNSKTTEVNPDIILILAESLFDLDGVDDLYFDVDIDETIDKYSTASILSPRYGGYTSAMEFEALTGLSLAFMPASLTPFTTYFNNSDAVFPGIVQELKKSGYFCVAMHPNAPDFYNRTIVYKNMGFDEYQSISSFTATQENTTSNGWITDDELGNHIIDELESTESPKFVYAVTMEGHYVNVDKYDEPQVHVTSHSLSGDVLSEVSQQATSYYHTDQMIQKVINYMDATERPTLLYVFGDHLPPLGALSELGYINDLQNKYKTSLVMYSNYKNISVGTEYITPNQLAVQIVTDAEINHHSYFDYLLDLRTSYPVVQQELTDVIGNRDLDIYRFIQYDILFGDRYLVK